MPETLLSTREVAAYLHINEKQVYRLIRKRHDSMYARYR